MAVDLLNAVEISCFRGSNKIFHRLSLTLKAGEVLQILGPNGSGKTTLLKILSGILEPQEGHIAWRGKSIKKISPVFFQEIFSLGHQNGIKNDLTVYENIILDSRFVLNKKEIAEDVLKQVSLHSHQRDFAGNLSQGQKQRLALAKLLAAKRPLWILDEPFSSLDKEGIFLLENLIQEHIKNDGSIILSTHRLLTISNDFSIRSLNLTKD